MNDLNTFQLEMHDTAHTQSMNDVVSFTGEDLSGSFGILARREKFITCLRFGMARLTTASGKTFYIAMPGGVLYFDNNLLSISTRHFVMSDNFEQIHNILQQELLDEEIQLQSLKKSFHTMENELLKRLVKTGHAL